jgi:hypothetical protein
MTRTDILNYIINKHNFKSYLEIGVSYGENYESVKCEYKVGVDPNTNSKATIFKTSDDYFSDCEETFDIIFIDGLHLAEQFVKDVKNSLDHLNDNGVIVCHDCLPTTEHMQIREYDGVSAWTGDVWKGWVELRSTLSDVNMFVLDTDYGCGIIRKGKQELITYDSPLTWEDFQNNKDYLMNTVPTSQLKDI